MAERVGNHPLIRRIEVGTVLEERVIHGPVHQIRRAKLARQMLLDMLGQFTPPELSLPRHPIPPGRSMPRARPTKQCRARPVPLRGLPATTPASMMLLPIGEKPMMARTP